MTKSLYYAQKISRKSPDHQFFFGVVFFIVLIACKFSEQSEHILIFRIPKFFFFKEKIISLCKHMIFHSELSSYCFMTGCRRVVSIFITYCFVSAYCFTDNKILKNNYFCSSYHSEYLTVLKRGV